MKREQVIYWIATGIISLIFLFSIYMMYTPFYQHLGFPSYFKVELTIFKILGLIVFTIPIFPMRIKEWAYAGFTIVLISASVAHFNSGDSIVHALEPLIWLTILAVSYIYLNKLKKSAVQTT